MTTIIIFKDSLNSFVALSLLRTSSLDSVNKIICFYKSAFWVNIIHNKSKVEIKEKFQNDVYTLPAFARAFFIFCFVFSFEVFKKSKIRFVMRCKLKNEKSKTSFHIHQNQPNLRHNPDLNKDPISLRFESLQLCN